MASHRTLEVTLMSAKDLENVNFFSNLEIYAVASLSSDPLSQQYTPTDFEGRKNPNWNTTLRFSIPAGADTACLTLDIILSAKRSLGDRNVGEVHVPISELESGGAGAKAQQFVSYQVRRLSGRGKGVLNFSYRFGEPAAALKVDAPITAYPPGAKVDAPVTVYPSVMKVDEPVTAYPVYPQPYPQPGPYPPPSRYPGYHQPPGYPGYGYGVAPAVQQQQKRNRFGMGLGAGLLGGALGGLLIGDMVSDATDFGDAGFDF